MQTRSPRLILASTSPRRRELLGMLGFDFEVVGSDYDEETFDYAIMPPDQVVTELAVGKALTVAEQTTGDALVIGADTTVVLGGKYYAKPANPADAVRMLTELAGNTHQVYTGISIVPVEDGRHGKPVTDYAVTDVTFDPVPIETIEAYVATGEPLDKAGAYGIQGKALAFIPGINGDYFNVVGLPLNKLVALLGRFDVSVW
jgi:septum formation protein